MTSTPGPGPVGARTEPSIIGSPPRGILVPLDGSPFSQSALPFAVEIARVTGARVQLALVHEMFIAAGQDNMMVSPLVEERHRAAEREYLESLRHATAAEGDIHVDWEIADGPVVEALLTQSRQPGMDLVVMATHGRGGLKRLWLGSVADELVRRAEVPVLLVRGPAGRSPSSAAKPFRHILVPLDGSPLSESALPFAVGLARAMGSHTTLLQVVQTPPLLIVPSTGDALIPAGDIEAMTEQARASARERLGAIAVTLGRIGIRARVRIAEGQEVAEEILRQSRALHVDLIVLATHGRGGFRRLLLGSVADKVARGANVPVLAVRQKEPVRSSAGGLEAGPPRASASVVVAAP